MSRADGIERPASIRHYLDQASPSSLWDRPELAQPRLLSLYNSPIWYFYLGKTSEMASMIVSAVNIANGHTRRVPCSTDYF